MTGQEHDAHPGERPELLDQIQPMLAAEHRVQDDGRNRVASQDRARLFARGSPMAT
jgi:hypothetical protein